MNPGLFDVLHDRADHRCFAVRDAIDIHFDCVFEKTIDQDRPEDSRLGCYGRQAFSLSFPVTGQRPVCPDRRGACLPFAHDLQRGANITSQVVLVIDQLHAPSAEHETWPNEYRVADSVRYCDGFMFAYGRPARRLAQLQSIEHCCKQLSIFCGFDALRWRAENRDAGRFQSIGEIERCLSTELNDDAFGLFLLVNVEHVLKGERFEIKFVARVVIGRNGFRIRVHHDRFESEFAQREGRVHAAVIELDALTDAVRSAAKNHDLGFAAFAPLVLVAVG